MLNTDMTESRDCLSVGVLVADHMCAPLDRLPKPGELLVTDQLLLTIGGCASNAAMDMARVGVGVSVVGCVGNDAFGQFIIDTLHNAAADTRLIRKLDDVGTSATLIVNVKGEDRRFIHTLGANARLTAADIPWEEIRRSKVFYVGGYLLMPALEQRELAELFAAARKEGVTTVLDVVLPGPGDYWHRLEKLLPYTDVFLPNTDEAAELTGLADPKAQAERFFAAGAGTVVITCGGDGTYLRSANEKLFAEVYKFPYVGGTGAGDAFDAGYITGLLQGLGPRDCMAWGSALGGSCVRSISATESVFTRDEAEAYINEHPLKISTW